MRSEKKLTVLGLTPITKAVALTSLINALDQVDSTMGHFVSYLREWSPRSYKTMQLEVPAIVETAAQHTVIQRDIFDIASSVKADLAYYDPPYGSNNEKMPPSRVRYSSYYHVWTTICLNDQPKLFGKVNRRSDSRDQADPSIFEEFRRGPDGHFLAVEAIHKLLKCTPTRHLILSYSSGGRATAKELDAAIADTGVIEKVIEVDYRRNVMAGMKWTNEWLREAEEPNREFLFLIKRQ
jgi:adenine-specific DNA-methyltransferase